MSPEEAFVSLLTRLSAWDLGELSWRQVIGGQLRACQHQPEAPEPGAATMTPLFNTPVRQCAP